MTKKIAESDSKWRKFSLTDFHDIISDFLRTIFFRTELVLDLRREEALALVDVGSAIKNDLSEKALAQWRQSGGWHDGAVAVETMFNSRAGKAVEAQRQ